MSLKEESTDKTFSELKDDDDTASKTSSHLGTVNGVNIVSNGSHNYSENSGEVFNILVEEAAVAAAPAGAAAV